MKNVLVTGGCGFIGGNFIRHLLAASPKVTVFNLDKLTYAGNPESLSDISKKRHYRFIRGDICDDGLVKGLIAKHSIDTIVNFAAESHVDRSILGPGEFVRTNVSGTQTLLEAARQVWGIKGFRGRKFLQVSTDEVYGSLGPKGRFTEKSSLSPSSPYSASKAAADLIVSAYHKTYNFPAMISRCSNNYGPYQFPEKFIPLMIVSSMKGDGLPVYGDGRNVRDWIHVLDHCSALRAMLLKGRPGCVYNVGGGNERRNMDVARLILKMMNRPASLIKLVKDRPGHDLRYAVDSSKTRRELKWKPEYDFDSGLKETIDWYVSNSGWWKRVMTGEYKKHFSKWYSER